MTKVEFFSLVLLVVISISGDFKHFADASNYDGLKGHQVWRVASNGADEGQATMKVLTSLQAEGRIDIWGMMEDHVSFSVVPEHSEYARSLLQNHEINFQVDVEDLYQSLKAQEESELLEGTSRTEPICTEYSCPTKFLSEYMTLTEINWYINLVKDNSNGKVNVATIGDPTAENRHLNMLHIKSNTGAGCQNPKKVWIEAGIHAREWIAHAVGINLIDKIVNTNNINMTCGVEYYFVPAANPDGYVYTWEQNRMWRKNRRVNAGTSCRGVDLNRNWDNHWGETGADSIACSNLYAGPNAFSEPETKAMSDQIKKVKPHLCIAFHSYGQFVLYPWGYDENAPEAPFTEEMETMGKAFTDGVMANSGKKYILGPGAKTLYAASGAMDDWAKDQGNCKYTYTIELRGSPSSNTTFALPKKEIKSTVNEVWVGFQAMIAILRNDSNL